MNTYTTICSDSLGMNFYWEKHILFGEWKMQKNVWQTSSMVTIKDFIEDLNSDAGHRRRQASPEHEYLQDEKKKHISPPRGSNSQPSDALDA